MAIIVKAPQVKQKIKVEPSEDPQAKAMLTVIMPLRLKAKLAAVAQEQNISASEFIRRAVQKALVDWKKGNN